MTIEDDSRGRRKAASQRVWALLLLASMPVCVAVGCRTPANDETGISIVESIAPQPVRAQTETVSFRLTNEAHQPVASARVQVEADMNHPGMAPVFAQAIETAPGDYRAPLNFTMGGDWVVLFHITLSDGRKVERQMDVKGVESN
ncbi:MAG: FixH family protein [Terracidiphilus sp.]